jgi:hypothetical protein
MKPSVSVLLAVAMLAAGCTLEDGRIIYRPTPSPDSGELPPAKHPAQPAEATDPPESAEPVEPAGPAAPAPAAVPSGWRELTGAGGESYEIQPADTLSEIAMNRLGTMHNLPLLMLANRRLTKPEMVWKGETILIPGPGFFAAPFARPGEKAVEQKLLRYSESSREGFVGVSFAATGSEAGRFLAVQVKAGKVRAVFDSAGLLPRAPAGGKEEPWTWRAIDLDADGGLDLVGSRTAGPGEAFQACVFQETARGYRRHVLSETVRGGEFEGKRAIYRENTLSIRGEVPAGRGQFEPATLRYRWVGDKFEVSRE